MPQKKTLKRKSLKRKSFKRKSFKRRSLRRRSSRGGANTDYDIPNFDDLPVFVIEFILKHLSEDQNDNNVNKCKNVVRYCNVNKGNRKICKESKSIQKVSNECKNF